jgi:hypothetical protein
MPAQRNGDVLAVHQDIDERLEVTYAGRLATRPGHRAQPRGVLRHGQPGLPDRRVVDHPVEVPAGPDRRDHGGKQSQLGLGEVGGDVTHSPSGAQ